MKNRNKKDGRKLARSGKFSDLVKIMDRLLGPGGCPWDRRQTHATLIKYLKEESAEAARAVRKKDWSNLKEELGDVLLQVVFHSALARKKKIFSIRDVIRSINAKLVRRHPHVFGDAVIKDHRQLLKEWNRIKELEKKRRAR